MAMDVEAGLGLEKGFGVQVGEGGEQDDSVGDKDKESSEHSGGGGAQQQQQPPPPCLCQQFQRRGFLRRLEEEAVVEFQWMTFYKELLYNVFFPLSLPFLYYFEGGTAGIINRQYWGSRLAIHEWVGSISFYAMNVLTPLFISPDIVITNVLIIMRHLVIATKYGFYTKSDMAEMRKRVWSHEALDERTLFIAWLNPIPLRVLKRQLLLAAIRKNMVNCTAALRVIPGASRHTVQEIMHRLSHEKVGSCFMRRGRIVCHKPRNQSKVNIMPTNNCAYCVKNFCMEEELEDRWIELCICRIESDPNCNLPDSGETTPNKLEDGLLGYDEDTNGLSYHENYNLGSSKDAETSKNDEVDLPILMLAAHLIQHSGYLLSKKKFGHWVLKSDATAWFAAACVAILHTGIPFAIRAIAGRPPVWGGDAWYVYVVSLSSIILNLKAMTMSVSFMLAGVADYRRRYFSARLLNTLLKDGTFGSTFSSGIDNEETNVDHALEQYRLRLRKKSDYHLGVAVNYSQAASIVGWFKMRLLVQDFGLVFSRRVKYYASYFSVYCGVLMAFLVIMLFTKGTRSTSYILGVVAYDLIVFMGLLALIVFPGGETNGMHLGHGVTLITKKMELFRRIKKSPLSDKEMEAPKFALEMMQTISECLMWDNIITKVTILGFTAGSEFVGVLLGFAGAAIGIVAQQFTAYIGA